MTEPMTTLGAFCLSYIVLFVPALFFALVLCRVTAKADERAAELRKGKGQ